MSEVQWRALLSDLANGSNALDDRREAVTTLEDAERTARRVFGGAHPLTEGIGEDLTNVPHAVH